MDKNYDRTLAERAAKAHAAAEKGTGYVVADGRALTTPRGVIGSGEPIGPLDFQTDADFDHRKAEGYVVPEKRPAEDKKPAVDDKGAKK